MSLAMTDNWNGRKHGKKQFPKLRHCVRCNKNFRTSGRRAKICPDCNLFNIREKKGDKV